VTSLGPRSGPATGGTLVTLTGSGFVPGQTTVTFGGSPATAVVCPAPTTCIATSPPGQGTIAVRVTAGGRTSPDTPATTFTYVPAPAPPRPPPPAPPPPPALTPVMTNRSR
jgi:hypothetical protein